VSENLWFSYRDCYAQEKRKERMKYKEQLETVQWKTKKSKVLKRDNYKCTQCKCGGEELHVHHIYYTGGHLAWEYPENALITLCKTCHKSWHKTHKLEIRSEVWDKNRKYKAPEKVLPKKKGVIKKRKAKDHKEKLFRLAESLGWLRSDETILKIINGVPKKTAERLIRNISRSKNQTP
jgi:5-methylcytosine-specific restriction endonuclease McrA